MSEVVLPKEIAYSPSLNALPECTSQEIVLAPVNGAKFGPSDGQLIQFDLPSRGYLDPSSIYIRYNVTHSSSTSTDRFSVRATPVYTYFAKLETLFGSSIVESINQYGQVCNMWTNLQMDIGMKYGMQTAYGWSQTSTPSIEVMDGRLSTVNSETFSMAAPLPCILSASERLVPLGLMPAVRIQLTTDSIANIYNSSTPPSAYSINNIELCYTMIDFKDDVNNIVKSMGHEENNTFYIKSTSFQNMATTLGTGVSGAVELVYNMRLASIKSIFAHFSGLTSTKCINGIYDSVDVTSGDGDYQFNIAGTSYPSRPLNTKYNKAGILMELKKAVGALHSSEYNFSINNVEFTSIDSTATTTSVPGKFFLGQNLEKLSTSSALLSGISTNNSPVTLRINIGATATTQAYTVYLISMFDVLIAVDPINRQATVKQ